MKLVIALLFLLTSCTPVKPDGSGVRLLSKVGNCEIYKFMDYGTVVVYAVCNGSVTALSVK